MRLTGIWFPIGLLVLVLLPLGGARSPTVANLPIPALYLMAGNEPPPSLGCPAMGVMHRRRWGPRLHTYVDGEAALPGGQGQQRWRLGDNLVRADCAYPGVEVLPDGTIVSTTYGHWSEGESPYVVCVRFQVEELDAQLEAGTGQR